MGCLGPPTPGARTAVEVGERLGSHGFVAGPPGLTVQLDHGVGPGRRGLRGGRGRCGAQGAVGLRTNAADGCGCLGLAGGLAAVHLVAHKQHEDEDQYRGHDDSTKGDDHGATQEGCVRGPAGPQRRLGGEAGAAHGPRGRQPCGAVLVHCQHAQIVGAARRQVRQQERVAVGGDHPGGTGRWGVRSLAAQHPPCTVPQPSGPISPQPAVSPSPFPPRLKFPLV